MLHAKTHFIAKFDSKTRKMNYFFALLAIPVLLASCSDDTPKKTVKLNEDQLTQTEEGVMMKQVLVSAGQTMQGKEIKRGGIKFDLVLEKKDTLYLSTSDNRFLTPENYRSGMLFSEIPAALKKKLEKETGWGYYIALPSGWNLGFCEGASCTDAEPVDSSKVKWIFRRKA
jgi:hypothetical protein